MGLSEKDGRRYYDAAGNQRLKNPLVNGRERERLDPKEFSVKALFEAITGNEASPENVAHAFNNGDARRSLFEDTGAGAIGASAFANINAFTATVSGLLEVSVMEGFQNPMYIADMLMPPEQTKMFDGRKVIGTTRIGDQAEERLPGMPTKRVQIGERWITQPRTVENALSCEVLQETVYLDLTGEVLQQANKVGEWLAYRKELRVIDAFIGVTNTYRYKDTAYNTYIANGYFDNTFANELLHESDVEEVLIKFRDMKDPETDTRIMTNPNMVLVQREKLRTAEQIFGSAADMVQYRDAPGSTTNPQNVRSAKPFYTGKFQIIESPLVFERINAANGLNVNAANSAKYWWTWEKGKPFVYAQNWPLRTQQAAPNTVDMIDRGVVLFVKADERGIPMVKEPRFVVRCTA